MNETSFRTSLMSGFDISNVEAVGHINREYVILYN
jgi:hypothetical protein